MKIIRVDVKNERIAFEDLKEEWRSIGGSAFIAKGLEGLLEEHPMVTKCIVV